MPSLLDTVATLPPNLVELYEPIVSKQRVDEMLGSILAENPAQRDTEERRN